MEGWMEGTDRWIERQRGNCVWEGVKEGEGWGQVETQ